MKSADARAGEGGEADGAGLGSVDRAARTVSREDGGMAGFDDRLEAEEGLLSSARAGTAHGLVTEELESARDQFAVEALADDDRGAGAAEIKRTGQDALVPEAKNLGACSSA